MVNESVSSDRKEAGFELFFNRANNLLPVVVTLFDNGFVIALERFKSVSLLFSFCLSNF